MEVRFLPGAPRHRLFSDWPDDRDSTSHPWAKLPAMPVRLDVSAVPLQGAYPAKHCPVRAQNDVLRPCEPIPVSLFTQRLFDRGNAFEAETFAELMGTHPDAVMIDEVDSATRIVATVAAMDAGAPLILGGQLSDDLVGRRVGKPDILVRAAAGGYHAIDVKNHRTLAVADKKGPARVSEFSHPGSDAAFEDDGVEWKPRDDDALQLAHYQRMLEASGHAAKDGRHGAIIGTERRVVWIDLDKPLWTTPSSTGKQKTRTTMDRYDFEFGFRLDIIATAREHVADPAVPLLVVPARIAECNTCPWWDACRPILEQGTGDVTLLPDVGWKQREIHHARGITDRAQIADLDITTAQLVANDVRVDELTAFAESEDADARINEHKTFKRRPKQIKHLEAAGLTQFGDAARLCPKTASYADVTMATLAKQIDDARAMLGPHDVYRRRGLGDVSIPRADVEVDIDMENVEGGVYLWGALVHDTQNGDEEFLSFSRWEPLTAEVEAELGDLFWTWLSELRAATHASGRSFKAYCYHSPAESSALRTFGAATGRLDAINELLGSTDWVDMLKVFRDQFITGHSSGLKIVAPLSGFEWDVKDPGGGDSMVYHDIAVGPDPTSEREQAREWLVTYNRGDVAATYAIREWLSLQGSEIPRIEDAHPNG